MVDMEKWALSLNREVERLRAENERLTAEIDQHVKMGTEKELRHRLEAAEAREAKAVEDMRERAARVAEDAAPVTCDMQSTFIADICDDIAETIRALPTEAQNG